MKKNRVKKKIMDIRLLMIQGVLFICVRVLNA